MFLQNFLKANGFILGKQFFRAIKSENGSTLRRFAANSECVNTSSGQAFVINHEQLFDFKNDWPTEERSEFLKSMLVVNDFVSEAEEAMMLKEAEQSIKRLRYEFDHWDNAIHGYRETEKKNWYPDNRAVVNRVSKFAFDGNAMAYVHVLDLAADGVIKAHVDSTRYCGSTIAGLSLLTDCIMRLRRVDESEYDQSGADSGKQISSKSVEGDSKHSHYVDVLLKRRSLYVMGGLSRYKFSHEVLPTNSEFRGAAVNKDRRISIICRNEP